MFPVVLRVEPLGLLLSEIRTNATRLLTPRWPLRTSHGLLNPSHRKTT